MWQRALTDLDVVLAGIDAARKSQQERGKPLSVQALGLALGCHRDRIGDYAQRRVTLPDSATDEERAIHEQICDALYRAWLECDRDISDNLAQSGNQMGSVFLAKNCYGYKDKTEQDLAISLPVFIGEDKLE